MKQKVKCAGVCKIIASSVKAQCDSEHTSYTMAPFEYGQLRAVVDTRTSIRSGCVRLPVLSLYCFNPVLTTIRRLRPDNYWCISHALRPCQHRNELDTAVKRETCKRNYQVHSKEYFQVAAAVLATPPLLGVTLQYNTRNGKLVF